MVNLKNKALIKYLISALLLISTYHVALQNQLYNLDSVYRNIHADPVGLFISAGRLWREILDHVLGVGMLPAGITLTISFVIFCNLSSSITRIFKVKNEITKSFLLFIIVTFPLISYYFLYGNDIIYYSFALLFAAFSVELLKNRKYALAIPAIVIALFGYQMAFSFATALLIFLALNEVINNKFSFRVFALRLFLLCVGGLVYIITWKLIMIVFGIAATNYMGASSFSMLVILKNVISSIGNVYLQFFTLVFGYFPYFGGNVLIKSICYINLLILILYLPISQYINKTIMIKQAIIYYMLVSILPIFMFSSSLVLGFSIPRSEFGILMFFLFPIILIIEKKNKLMKYIGIFLATSLVIYSSLFINAMLLVALDHVQSDTILVDTIYNDLASMTNVTDETKLGICGSYMSNEQYVAEENYPFVFEDMYLQSGPSIFFNVDEQLEDFRLDAYLNRYSALFERNGYDIEITYTGCEENESSPYYPSDGYIRQISENVYEVKVGPEDVEKNYVVYA